MSGTAVGLLFALGLVPIAATAQELPAGGNVTSGTATITTSGSNLLVHQTSQNAIVSWQSFSIGGGATAHFENGSGATLNRVTGNLPSSIDGSLTATGSLYLINPAGVAVGTGGMVRTGGTFVASTHDASDADFLDSGDLTLKGASKASVVNGGFITSLLGDVVLTARRVENSGTIEAPGGSVGLLGGYEVLLRDTSLANGKFAVQVGGTDTEVVNTGTIRAAEIELRANGGSVQALAGNTKAIVKATGVKKDGGRIFLTAGDDGTVAATQKMVARRAVQPAQRQEVAALPDFGPLPATRPDFSGGEVHIAGGTVSLGGEIDAAGAGAAGGTITATTKGSLSLYSTAALDASGSTGGLILLGGDYQGGANPATRTLETPLATAATTTVASGATIHADGTAGDGGRVVVWSDDFTTFAGDISARGGGQSGNGGNAEVSGKAVLDYRGFADLTAFHGAFGTLLLDPYNVVISSGADTGGFIANADNSVINATTLMNQLAVASVTISTGAGGNQVGDITVAAPITWSTNAKLTLNAYHSIVINAPMTIAGAGGLELFTNHGGTLSLAGGVQYTGTPNSGQSLAINGAGYTLLYSMADLQGINTYARLNDNYALAKSLDAVSVSGWTPLGTNGAGALLNGSNGFAGTFTGLGNTISNLTVDTGNASYAGLFGYLSGAISDIGLIGGSVKGDMFIGGLAGYQYTGSITRAYATGKVTGTDVVGGLVGAQLGGKITQAYATGAVTGASNVGGLVGNSNSGTITQAYATGAVMASGVNVGGLVGIINGNITQAYATGAVTSSNLRFGDSVGGLVGYLSGSLTQAYATGAVTSTGPNVGGLVGYRDSSSISNSYFDSYSTGRSNAVGSQSGIVAGITAVTSEPGQSVAVNYAYKKTAYTDNLAWAFTDTVGAAGDWIMIDGQTRPFGAWEYSPTISNSHQLQLVNMDLNASYRLAHSIDLAPDLASAMVNGNVTYAGMWRQGSFVPLGTDGAGGLLNANKGFAGMFTGLGNTISNLKVDIGGNRYAGLFGFSTGGAISDIGLIDGLVKGGSFVGGLVGNLLRGSITQAYATATVTGSGDYVGGLAGGQEGGSIAQSHATGKVTGSGKYVGGLAGYQGTGSITQSYATGAVTGSSDSVGGLVGYQTGGTITQSYAIGAVTGGQTVGGLVGLQDGSSITQSYATGTVAGGAYTVGGLVGAQGDSSITQSYATGAVTGSGSRVGGLVGFQYSGTITQAYATGAVTGNDTFSHSVGGLVGLQESGGHITDSYFDTGMTGQINGVGSGSQAGVTALTSTTGTTAFDKASYAGFDWTVWAPPSLATGGGTNYYPELFGVSGVVGVDYGTTFASYTGLATSIQSAPKSIYGIGYFNTWITMPGDATDTGTDAGTYSLVASGAAATFVPGGSSRIVNMGSLTITPAALQVTAKDTSKVYDGLAWSDGNGVTYSGFVNGEDAGVLGGSVVWRGAAQGATNVGDYELTASGLTSGNYDISYVAGQLEVKRADLTVTAKDASKVYDGLAWSSGNDVTYSGFVNNEDALALGGSVVWGGAAQGATNAGDYALTASGLTSGNYDISYIPGQLEVKRADLTVTAKDASKVYDGLAWSDGNGVTYSGFVNNEDALTLGGSVVWSGTAQGATNAGDYELTATGLTSGNYDISYAPGQFKVTPRSITVAALGGSSIYGDAGVNPGLSATNLANGENVSVLTGLSNSFGIVPESAARDYTLTVTGALTNSNYTVSTTTVGIWKVNRRAITVSANDLSRLYGNANPGLSFGTTIGGDGLASFDADLAAAGYGLTTTADVTSVVGDYGIELTGANANYAITFDPGTLTVNRRVITVSATDQSRLQGAVDPALTWAITNGGLASFDTIGGVFSGALIRAPGETAGDYAIGQGSLLANANYAVAFVPGTFTITPAQYTGSQVLEQQGKDGEPLLLLSNAGNDDPEGACSGGVSGPDCAPYVSAGNRNLGPYIGMTE